MQGQYGEFLARVGIDGSHSEEPVTTGPCHYHETSVRTLHEPTGRQVYLRASNVSGKEPHRETMDLPRGPVNSNRLPISASERDASSNDDHPDTEIGVIAYEIGTN